MTKSFGDLVLFENISLGLSEGQRVGLIAKNGSGKTTLLNILSGKEGYDNGTISFRRDLRVGYLEQDPPCKKGMALSATIFMDSCFFLISFLSGNKYREKLNFLYLCHLK